MAELSAGLTQLRGGNGASAEGNGHATIGAIGAAFDARSGRSSRPTCRRSRHEPNQDQGRAHSAVRAVTAATATGTPVPTRMPEGLVARAAAGAGVHVLAPPDSDAAALIGAQAEVQAIAALQFVTVDGLWTSNQSKRSHVQFTYSNGETSWHKTTR